MDASLPLSYEVQLDDFDEPPDVLTTLVLEEFLAGTQPWSVSARLQRVRRDARLLPPQVEPARHACQSDRRSVLAQGDGWTLHAVRWTDATARVTVTATSDELARSVLLDAINGAAEDLPPAEEATSIGFWHLTPHGGTRIVRSIATTPWSEIRRNYSAPVAGALDRLMDFRAEGLGGRLLLLHGPPGTGKTTALRAMAHAWRDWCRVEYVLDPERLLQDSSYLMGTLLEEDDDDAYGGNTERPHVLAGCGGDEIDDNGNAARTGAGWQRRKFWRLLVLEDCDELIRADAKQSSGQALGRLLNLTDGLVGQGLEALVCITTNEELGRLHPAVIRPGRCLAHVHIGRLSQSEATTWLGADSDAHVGSDGLTLAELYALRGDFDQVENPLELQPSGQYL